METLTFDDYSAQMRPLGEVEIQEVSGGVFPWAFWLGVAGVFGGAFSLGYTFGRDYWAP